MKSPRSRKNLQPEGLHKEEERIKKNKKRPLALNLSTYEINNLIEDRSKKYKQSNYTINCDKLNKIQIVKKILKFYEKNRT